MSQKLFVGMQVHYFYNAVSPVPNAAMVTGINGLMIEIIVWERTSWRPRQQVFHRDAPQLKQNPQLAAKFGCWDFIPELNGVYPPPPPPVVNQAASPPPSPPADPPKDGAKDSKNAKQPA